MASKAAQKRLSKEYVAMQKEPPPFVWAAPDEKNILTWNYLIRGPPDSPFAGGEYHGVLLFPSEYPFKPPGIKMLTPSGRFQPDRKICFSMSDFHPGSWNPAWSVATILTGLLSFMLSEEMTTGSVTSSDSHKRAFAARSHSWNITQQRFKDAFPEYCTPALRDLPNMGEKERGKPDNPPIVNFVNPPPVSVSSSSSSFASVASSHTEAETRPSTQPQPNSVAKPNDPNRAAAAPAPGWMAAWRHFIYEKWRLCAFIALAVMLSRFTTRT
ncbi:ubiquitin-conjugating enzyme/RWD-like protein [Gymnopilus junonius]|uniref:Ubiquitin-conjugating enzyme E2 6 n=1 Tax=Gymnopilus junonius TaxID=109634 RepID=A0A9P5TI00_GYMJU|nr:ubiquitin-conjugating enzyme/RWD-like protein [Gymnopilus junonius]